MVTIKGLVSWIVNGENTKKNSKTGVCVLMRYSECVNDAFGCGYEWIFCNFAAWTKVLRPMA